MAGAADNTMPHGRWGADQPRTDAVVYVPRKAATNGRSLQYRVDVRNSVTMACHRRQKVMAEPVYKTVASGTLESHLAQKTIAFDAPARCGQRDQRAPVLHHHRWNQRAE